MEDYVFQSFSDSELEELIIVDDSNGNFIVWIKTWPAV